jgi:hypothetical protein
MQDSVPTQAASETHETAHADALASSGQSPGAHEIEGALSAELEQAPTGITRDSLAEVARKRATVFARAEHTTPLDVVTAAAKRLSGDDWAETRKAIERHLIEGRGTAGGLLAKRVKVGEKVKAGIPPVSYVPGELAHRMIYAAGVTGLSGHPESGKSSLACCLALDAAAAGANVVYLDWENGWQDLGRRLEDMGADSELLDKRLCYLPFPGPPDWPEYAEVARGWPDALWVFDSTRGLLGSLGIKENDASEVGQAMNALVEFVVGRELPALLIDHVTKAEDGSSGYARGSGDKLAAVQGQYYVKKVRDFSELEVGEIELVKWKARSGRLAARHRFAVGDGQGALTFNRLDTAASPAAQMDAAIYAFLKGIEPADASLNEVTSGVEGTAAKVRERVKEMAAVEAQPVKAVNGAGGHVRFAFDPSVDWEPAAIPF